MMRFWVSILYAQEPEQENEESFTLGGPQP